VDARTASTTLILPRKMCAFVSECDRSGATKVHRNLGTVDVEDGSRDETKTDCRDGLGPENKPMSQDSSDHCGSRHPPAKAQQHGNAVPHCRCGPVALRSRKVNSFGKHSQRRFDRSPVPSIEWLLLGTRSRNRTARRPSGLRPLCRPCRLRLERP
jgi:hypothetical protein